MKVRGPTGRGFDKGGNQTAKGKPLVGEPAEAVANSMQGYGGNVKGRYDAEMADLMRTMGHGGKMAPGRGLTRSRGDSYSQGRSKGRKFSGG